MSIIQWEDLPDRDVLDWLLGLHSLLSKLVLSKLQKRDAEKAGNSPQRKARVRKLADLLSGHSLQTISQRVFLSNDVYLRIFQDLWMAEVQPLMLDSFEELSASEALKLAEVLMASFEEEKFLSHSRAKVDSSRRSYQRSKRTLVNQLCQLKREYSKLMLVRVDLHYAKDYTKHAEPERRILDDWKFLRCIIAKQFLTSELGYFAKLEYGRDRSIHMHVLFLFNGRVVREDESIGRTICSIWIDEVTGGAGTAYNVNNPAKKAAYRNCGIGVFRHLDGATIAGFQAVADYLAKPEFLTRLAMPWQKRTIFSYFVKRRSEPSRTLSGATLSLELGPRVSQVPS